MTTTAGTGWDPGGSVVPEAAPYRPQSEPVAAEPPTVREMFNQRFAGATLMLGLILINALLWGIGDVFKVVFLAYTVLVGYWFWALFVKRPPT